MLIRLFGENFRSLRDPFELSFVAADLSSEGRRGIAKIEPKGAEGGSLDVLRCLAIYGPNASGKSTVLMAANALWWMIRRSSWALEPGKSIGPYEAFALSQEHRTRPVRLGCTIFFDGLLYEYEVVFTKEEILRETLTDGGATDEPLIARENDHVSGSKIDQSEHLRILAEQPKSNTPIFSFLAHHGPDRGEDSLHGIWQAFHSRLNHEDYSTADGLEIFDRTAKRLHDDDVFRSWVLDNLIRPADLGIRDIRIEETNVPEILRHAPDELRQRVVELEGPFFRPEFVHRGDDGSQIDFPDESAGTRKMYALATRWWALSRGETTIFGDELSASLHPLLLDQLVRAVNHARNGRSQLAFTTHDAGLLEPREREYPALRKDQVYFTQKDDTGATSLYSLMEFKDRPGVHNIRKRYLAGRYDAIPHIERLSLGK